MKLLTKIKLVFNKCIEKLQSLKFKIPKPESKRKFFEIDGTKLDITNIKFPRFEDDIKSLSWKVVSEECWDTHTEVDEIISGSFPIKPDGENRCIVLQQEFRRNMSWIPSCVQISTEWDGEPQPGLITYQWDIVPRFEKPSLNHRAQKTERNTFVLCNGKQFEPNSQQTYPVSFPQWKGICENIIGPMCALQLTIMVSQTATSTLKDVMVHVYHGMPEDCK